MVLFTGTGSAALGLGADLGAMVVLALIGGEANIGSGENASVDVARAPIQPSETK